MRFIPTILGVKILTRFLGFSIFVFFETDWKKKKLPSPSLFHPHRPLSSLPLGKLFTLLPSLRDHPKICNTYLMEGILKLINVFALLINHTKTWGHINFNCHLPFLTYLLGGISVSIWQIICPLYLTYSYSSFISQLKCHFL